MDLRRRIMASVAAAVASALAVLLVLVHSAGSFNVAHLVKSLPGQPKVNFKQYAGQVYVDKKQERALFYWFFEADHPNASSLPVTLWLNGGPGCSSVGNGALDELGPFRVNANGDGLVINDYAWTKASNIIFLESPGGVGYSFAPNGTVYNDINTAKDNLEFLLRWFSMFPEYRRNEFYITGESYAGHYIPTLAKEILAHNQRLLQKARPHLHEMVNFKGFAIGNPWTDPYHDNLGIADFYYGHSIISDIVYTVLKNCFGNNNNVSDSDCAMAVIAADLNAETLNPYDIYDDSDEPCVVVSKKVKPSKSSTHQYRLLAAYATCKDHIEFYLNDKAVQAALNVKQPQYWRSCTSIVSENYSGEDRETSMVPLHRELLQTGLRIWIYSGDFDSVCPTPGSRRWINSLNLPVEQPWYAWNSSGFTGGWSQVYQNLTFAVVRGAGHMVPSTRPPQSLQLFQAFLTGEPLEKLWN